MTAESFPATVMPDPDWWQALWPQPGQVLAGLGIAPGTGMAVDLCCGDGLFTAPLARLARHIVAIDNDPRMLALAREKVAAVSDAGACDFPTRSLRGRRVPAWSARTHLRGRV